MHEILHIAEHALLDSLKILPFLFLAFLLMEFCEHHGAAKITKLLTNSKGFGPAVGALFGLIPQCGFSVTAANLYSGGLISIGTLIAIFLSTSDEAFLILLGKGDGYKTVLLLMVCKLIIAIGAGLVIDLLMNNHSRHKDVHDLCKNCGCSDSSGVLMPALKHTVKIFTFVLVCNLILEGAVEFIGEDAISRILLSGSVFQPLIAAVIGLIPNCASSVMLTELYISEALSFGALLAGLAANSGVAIIVLFRQNRPIKDNFKILGITYLIAIIAGIILQILV